MLFILVNIIVLAFAAFASWWMSSFDTRLTGEDRSDRIHRGIRCGLTLSVVEVSFWSLWRYWRYDNRLSGVIFLITLVPLLMIWVDCISEMFARWFHRLINPENYREFDPNKSVHDLDTIASLIKNGRKEEAIRLCQALKESGDASVLAMETILELLGVPQNHVQKPKPLIEASRLREQGCFQEAELILDSLLVENPSNMDAALMLMGLYAQDMKRGDKAMEILQSLEAQPYILPAHVEFARRSIEEWQNPRTEKVVVRTMPESVDALLAQGYFGTTVEILEQKIKEQPQDFDLWLKLIEVHSRYCGNVKWAEKIIQQMETNSTFGREKIQQANAKIKEWRIEQTGRN